MTDIRQAKPDTSFIADAACRNIDTRIFIDETIPNITRAQAICNTCPVTQACLDYAISLPNTTIGIYAGHTTRQLNKLRKTGTTEIIHGTVQGYNAERRANLPTCPACRHANTQNTLKRRRGKV